MIIKKYYGDDDCVVMELTNLAMLETSTMLIGTVLESDKDGIFELGDEIAVLMSDSVEVLEP